MSKNLRLHALVLALSVGGALIGVVRFAAGPVAVVLLPLVFIFLGGAAMNPASGLVRALKPDAAADAARFLLPSFYLFLARLGVAIGAQAGLIARSGPALALQELGHLGTVLIGLPVAVLVLGLRREAVGATFSIGREASLAIVSDRYGMAGPEGAGVLGVYVTGLLAGTILFSVVAGGVMSLGLFDPRALAMACGLGSASMTAACTGALVALLPGRAGELGALAAAANLASTASGAYFSLFVALPLTEALYRLLTGGRTAASLGARRKPPARAPDGLGFTLAAVAASAAMAVPVTWAGGAAPGQAAIAVAALTAIACAGAALAWAIPLPVPALCWVSMAGAAAAWPGSPFAPFLAATAPTLDAGLLAAMGVAYAAFALTQADFTAFRRAGWRLFALSVVVLTGSFLGSAVVAQAALGLGWD